ncbi:hypothetical protein K458DRAFT_389348 [Lentithecium fluviatile CBS 122367]|uniref:Uncharacterized protein n=1 Tax=Lentithecium fluviatile CBS 122367 TaxID=1168545 RepID=A0A6G1J0T3_9PLEO|nr:hypothetical protein K458DRAFT_389348 [Lentithecium fluviatile CBS 122367]
MGAKPSSCPNGAPPRCYLWKCSCDAGHMWGRNIPSTSNNIPNAIYALILVYLSWGLRRDMKERRDQGRLQDRLEEEPMISLEKGVDATR